MRPIQERLAVLAADLREDSRKAGLAAEQARPEVEQAEAVLTALHKEEDDLKAQLAEMERRLAETQHRIAQAAADHRQAAAVLAQHEKDGQDAADTAERLDLLARDHKAPEPPPAPEALAATGLMVEEFRVEPGTILSNCTRCGEPTTAAPGRMTVHSVSGEPDCAPADDLTAPGVADSRTEVARNTGPIPVIAPPTPGDPADAAAVLRAIENRSPLTTRGDLPPHPPGHHAAPGKSRVTDAIKALIGRDTDDQDDKEGEA